MALATLRRSRLVQGLAYGGLLGVLSAVPTLVLQATGLFPRAMKLADEFFLAGGVPFVVAGAVIWLLVILRRGHTAPTGGGVLACWLGTVIVWYALVPVWISAVEVWNRCSSSGGPSLEQCWQSFKGMAAMAAIFSLWGFVFTAPAVLPLLLLGAWLWVRRLHPAIAGQPIVSR